jgi:hypothetical protein
VIDADPILPVQPPEQGGQDAVAQSLLGRIPTKNQLRARNACKTRCNGRFITIQFQVADLEGKGSFRAVHEVGGRSSGGVAHLRGRVVFDKSFVIMALACAAAPIVGAGIYIVVYLF